MEKKKFKIKVVGHNRKDDHIEYILVIENDEINITFTERYSNLKKLNELLKSETKNNSFPKFPPRKIFGGEDEKFLCKRQQELNRYFEAICNNQEFSNLKSFVKFIEDNIKKNSKNNNKIIPKQEIENKIIEKQEKKEITKIELIKTEEECSKIINEYIKLFYDVNNTYHKGIENENTYFIEFFKNNKINIDNENKGTIESGDDNNFNYIYKETNNILEKQIKDKKEKTINKLNTIDKIYETNGVIVNL